MESSGNQDSTRLENVSFLSNSHFASVNRMKNATGENSIFEYLICAFRGIATAQI